MKHTTLHMIGNAHLDPVWLWRWQEGFQAAKATFRSALDRMCESDDFLFTSSSAAIYEWVERNDPRMFAEIQARVAEGRWQIVGGSWIQPDCNIPCGESFARQGLYGQRYFKQKLGVTATVGYNVDSFGHHGMMPQILKQSGMDFYIFMRPGPHEKGLPGRLFWWESDDGSRVLAFRILYEYCTWGKELDRHVRRCFDDLKSPFDELMCFYGVGNHGGGPTKENLESIRRMDSDPAFPRMIFSTPGCFFADLLAKDLPIPTVHDDLQHHASGCYAAHSGIKRWNRQAENMLLAAEKFCAIAERVTGQPYPAELERAWKNVLFNQFHDILGGTSLEAAYDDARDLHGEAMAIAGRSLNDAIQSLAWNIDIPHTEGMQPIVVFNPHAWHSASPVELDIGGVNEGDRLLDDQGCALPMQLIRPPLVVSGWRRRISFVAELPPLGYRVYWVGAERTLTPSPSPVVTGEESPSASPSPATGNRQSSTPSSPAAAGEEGRGGEGTYAIENEYLRLTIDPATGALGSLYDKRHQLEVFCGQAARAIVIDDSSDTWSHGVHRFDKQIGIFSATRVRLVEHGPVQATIRVESVYGASKLAQEFTLYCGLDVIEVRVTVDWREQFKALALSFPVDLHFFKATYEIPYGQIERPADGEEEPGQSWIDLSGEARAAGVPYGLSLLNHAKYSFSVTDSDMRMTVLRSPIYAHHDPTVPEPDASYSFIDQGIQRFSYALLPHAGGWTQAGTVRRAAELNCRPIALAETYHVGRLPQRDSYLAAEPENIIVSAVKRAEDGDDLIVRCYETSGVATRATIRLPKWGRTIEASFGPSQIKTFRVPLDAAQPVVETNMIEW
jgi:alpha-mannosidase